MQIAIISVTSVNSARNLIRGMLIGGLILMVVGSYELVSFLLGLPWIGIIRADPALSGSQHIASIQLTGGYTFVRLASLGGEPKILAQSIAPLVFAVLIARTYKLRLGPILGSRFFLFGLLALLFLTFSISGWGSFMIAFPLVAWFALRQERMIFRSFKAFIPVGVGLSVIVIGVAGTDFLSDVLLARLAVPFQEFLVILDGRTPAIFGESLKPEFAALRVLANDRIFLWFGVGPGNGHFYIAPLIGHPLDAIVSVNSGVVREVLEWGLLGILAMFAIHFFAIKQAIKHRRMVPAGSELRGFLTIAIAIDITSLSLDWLFSSEISGQLWLYLGVLIAITRIAKAQQPIQTQSRISVTTNPVIQRG